jgi:hypothetical protein
VNVCMKRETATSFGASDHTLNTTPKLSGRALVLPVVYLVGITVA